jgi:ribosomal protein S18 acetylase RimI-like enzyme
MGLCQGNAVLVAVDVGDVPVGLVRVISRGAFDLSGYIRWIVVSAKRRGDGIGHLLLEAAEARVHQTGGTIFLICSDFNIHARRFYERHGYVQVGTIPNYMLPGVAEALPRHRWRVSWRATTKACQSFTDCMASMMAFRCCVRRSLWPRGHCV